MSDPVATPEEPPEAFAPEPPAVPAGANGEGELWQFALRRATERAMARYPDDRQVIQRANHRAFQGAVEILDATYALVPSASTPGRHYRVSARSCDCPDHFRRHRSCVHIYAAQLTRLAQSLVRVWQRAEERGTEGLSGPRRTVPSHYVRKIHEQSFIAYSGLLCLGHEDGLIELQEELIHISDTLVIAKAVARFNDGRVFQGIADATPNNVGKQVQPHFIRIAATRAKARALRDALGIDMVSVDELGDVTAEEGRR